MIICFSGTGNSRLVADELQKYLPDELVRLAPGLMNDPSQVDIFIPDERVIWVMPTHCWGIPKTAMRVIRESALQRPHGQRLDHFLVFTCGDDVGNGHLQWRREINKRGGRPLGMFSVQMPNSYTLMRGFDVDTPEVAKAKLDAMPRRVAEIAREIESGEPVIDVVRGKWPWVKTNIIYPWFMRYKTSTRPYHVNDRCAGCGVCASNCPLMSITIVDSRPVWSERCTMCLRCYHSCPYHAVEYGTATQGKGQYLCPGYTLANAKFKR